MAKKRAVEVTYPNFQIYEHVWLWDTVCSLMFMTFLFSVQDPGMHVFNFTTKKKVALDRSCTSRVGGAGNLIAVLAVNHPCTKYRLWRQLFPVGKISYRILHCI